MVGFRTFLSTSCRLYKRRRSPRLLIVLLILILSSVFHILMVLIKIRFKTTQGDRLHVRLVTGNVLHDFERRTTEYDAGILIQNATLKEKKSISKLIQKGNPPGILADVHKAPGRGEYERRTYPWKQFIDGITLDEMYPYSAAYIPDLLYSLGTAKIVNVSYFNVGTQVKFNILFEDGNKAVAKPMRHPRDFYWAYNESQPYWLDEERHTAEIAAFHLDRILNYRRVIPCVGRRVNFTDEFLGNTNDPAILKTFQVFDGRSCFIGECVRWFCNKEHMICEQDGVIELAICQRVPGNMPGIKHPWSQELPVAEVWKNRNVCNETLLNHPKITKSRFFLDMMELALFDHLIVNYDRHHIPSLDLIDFRKGFLITHDNGKGFGNPFKDDVTFLAPIYQCCRFRNSTYQHLLSLTKNNNTLGDLMKRSLSQDPLAPILTEPFFHSLDRRLHQFYFVMSKCIEVRGADFVLSEKYI